MLFLGQDLPHGNYAALRRAGSLPPSNSGREYYVAIRNYRTWVLTALYAFNFGVELTMNNGEHGRMQQLWERGRDRSGCTSRLQAIFGARICSAQGEVSWVHALRRIAPRLVSRLHPALTSCPFIAHLQCLLNTSTTTLAHP